MKGLIADRSPCLGAPLIAVATAAVGGAAPAAEATFPGRRGPIAFQRILDPRDVVVEAALFDVMSGGKPRGVGHERRSRERHDARHRAREGFPSLRRAARALRGARASRWVVPAQAARAARGAPTGCRAGVRRGWFLLCRAGPSPACWR
jgi:hypothetical protein